ncbi:MAG: hypothetical protein LBG80_02190 [Bacteroidales bacterium]|jgi:hypothetical protein|nr:hypothetical protein [Bacteroidales bacterium]
MGKIEYNEDYKSLISSLTDEELTKQYLQRERYIKKYLKLLIEEVTNRDLPLLELAPGVLKKVSNTNLYNFYNDFANEKNIQTLIEQEITNRGFNMETLEIEVERENKRWKKRY